MSSRESPIIGIGASAGGIDALHAFFNHMPALEIGSAISWEVAAVDIARQNNKGRRDKCLYMC